jgi:hypothetical protein
MQLWFSWEVTVEHRDTRFQHKAAKKLIYCVFFHIIMYDCKKVNMNERNMNHRFASQQHTIVRVYTTFVKSISSFFQDFPRPFFFHFQGFSRLFVHFWSFSWTSNIYRPDENLENPWNQKNNKKIFKKK